METNKPKEASPPVEADSAAADEPGSSRRDFLVQGGRVAAGIGVAALLGNLGNWALSYAADKEPIKIGMLHSLSGTMAISEVSLRDIVMMAVEEINAKGGVLGRKIKPVVVDPASNWDLFAEKAKQLLLQDKVVRGLRLLDLGQPEIRLAGLRKEQRPALLSRAVRGRGVFPQRVLHRGGAESAGGAGGGISDEQGRGRVQEVLSPRDGLRVSAHDEQDSARDAVGEESARRPRSWKNTLRSTIRTIKPSAAR